MSKPIIILVKKLGIIEDDPIVVGSVVNGVVMVESSVVLGSDASVVSVVESIVEDSVRLN